LEFQNEVESTYTSMSSSDSQQNQSSISDMVANITLSLTSEQKEKEKRKFNVILHNLSESTATDSSVRNQDDIDRCSSLFSNYLNATVSIKNAIHLGKRDSRPCRLLKLTLNSLEEKTFILRHKIRFKSDNNPGDIRKFFVTPYLIPLEQKKHNALRQQLAEMNKVQNIYTIRNGQIVQKTQVDTSVPAYNSDVDFS